MQSQQTSFVFQNAQRKARNPQGAMGSVEVPHLWAAPVRMTMAVVTLMLTVTSSKVPVRLIMLVKDLEVLILRRLIVLARMVFANTMEWVPGALLCNSTSNIVGIVSAQNWMMSVVVEGGLVATWQRGEETIVLDSLIRSTMTATDDIPRRRISSRLYMVGDKTTAADHQCLCHGQHLNPDRLFQILLTVLVTHLATFNNRDT